MSEDPVNNGLKAHFSAKIEELKEDFDCHRCRACQFRDCDLATHFRLLQRFDIADRREAEERAWMEELRRLTLPPEPQAKKPTLDDFDGTVWGHA
jgi:hypothetical protein